MLNIAIYTLQSYYDDLQKKVEQGIKCKILLDFVKFSLLFFPIQHQNSTEILSGYTGWWMWNQFSEFFRQRIKIKLFAKKYWMWQNYVNFYLQIWKPKLFVSKF